MAVSISFIIPCYNVSKCIERCLDSIIVYPEAEIILVDDCSQDDTIDVIKKYKERHINRQIKLILNETNQGAGQSRNIGIRQASKEYITFVDADDCIIKEYFEIINKIVKDKDIECIVNDAQFIQEKKIREISMFFSGKVKEGIIDQDVCLAFVKGTTWGKTYKTNIIKQHNIKFATIKRNEDVVFTKNAVSHCRRIFYVKKPLYKYYDMNNSLMHNQSLLTTQNAFNAFEQISKEISTQNYRNEIEIIYLIEIVYATTLTCIRLGMSNKEILMHYRKVIGTCDFMKENAYYKDLSFRYKFILLMMKLHLFGVIRLIA